jgi:hypothetical protein|tara:strand:- start:259 stop:753 length:495 start_codon:yes stop_codon:yes gene_type:complete
MYKKIIKRGEQQYTYYIYIDYSENLIGYTIIHKDKIEEILPKISKLHHYRRIRYKRQYIRSIKKIIDKNNIMSFLLKYKIRKIRNNAFIFADVLDFVKNYDNCGIFISVDNHQYNAFMKLFGIIPHKKHVFVIKESKLKKESIEYKLSLIIDNLLNIERIKMSK